jgi:8-oxo-dGTP pyrophosphatase MutT (NUDIX family)
MVGSSILPVTIHKNKLLFLFGKETAQDETPGWSDFGGGMESGETPIETALREGGEELTGFLGDANKLKRQIKTNGNKIYHISHELSQDNSYHVHMIYLPYDENLPKYYNQNHEFLWKRMNRKVLKKTCLFEKINIEWFSIPELRAKKNTFRKFYQEILEHILQETPKIKRFFQKKNTKRTQKMHKKNKTRRM